MGASTHLCGEQGRLAELPRASPPAGRLSGLGWMPAACQYPGAKVWIFWLGISSGGRPGEELNVRGEGRGEPVPCLAWERAWVCRAAVGDTASGAGRQGQIPAPSLSSCVTTGRRLGCYMVPASSHHCEGHISQEVMPVPSTGQGLEKYFCCFFCPAIYGNMSSLKLSKPWFPHLQNGG